MRRSVSRDDAGCPGTISRVLEEVFRATSLIGRDWDLPVDPSPNALEDVLHFDYDHIGCCSKVSGQFSLSPSAESRGQNSQSTLVPKYCLDGRNSWAK